MDTDTNADLLKRFVQQSDGDAFADIVARHGGMVRGVALRCTGDETLADEVTQTVFTVLTRKAASVRPTDLPGWLHKAASLAGLAARRKSRRYHQALADLSSQQNAMSTSPQNDDSMWKEIRPHLDEAISSLPDKARKSVILRFFEGRSIREIASASGRTEEASRKEIQRALDRLSGILRRRGITTTGVALGTVLGAQNLFAPPASAAAVATAALQAGSSLAASGALISQTAFIMTTTKAISLTTAAVLLASVPAVIFWNENTELRREVSELRVEKGRKILLGEPALRPQAPTQTKAPAVARKPVNEPAKPSDGAAILAALFNKDALTKRAEEDAVKNAEKDMQRISLYLTDLSDEQKAQVRAILESVNKTKLEAFKKAWVENGALEKVMEHPEKATPEDYALMAAAAPIGQPLPQDDPLAAVLTPDQFSLYREKLEEKRVGDAEGGANDAIKTLGGIVDLSAEQKDHLFQALASAQLSPVPDLDSAKNNAFLDQRLRDQQKEEIIQQHLTPEQAGIYSQKKAEDKRNAEAFFNSLKGQEKK